MKRDMVKASKPNQMDQNSSASGKTTKNPAKVSTFMPLMAPRMMETGKITSTTAKDPKYATTNQNMKDNSTKVRNMELVLLYGSPAAAIPELGSSTRCRAKESTLTLTVESTRVNGSTAK